jgi:maleate cis-trans isomerase
MAQNEIETVKCADVGRELGNYGQGELTPNEVFDLACQADHQQAEAIVLSCTDMRSVEAIEQIEAALGKPVVTSNQAMMFCLLRELGLPPHKGLPGRLFDCV